MNRALVILLALATAACGLGPTGVTGDEVLVVFIDPAGDFETTDVHDVEREVVLFTEAGQMLVGDTLFPGWSSRGNALRSFGDFTVRFGDEDGERRAFFTETDTATICDIEIEAGEVRTFSTPERVPTAALQ